MTLAIRTLAFKPVLYKERPIWSSTSNFHHVSFRSIRADRGVAGRPVPERAQTPPHPSIVIPFERDVEFMERVTILEQLCIV